MRDRVHEAITSLRGPTITDAQTRTTVGVELVAVAGALAIAVAAGLSPLGLALAVGCGVGLGWWVWLLASDRPTTLVVGGVVAPLVAAAGLAGLGLVAVARAGASDGGGLPIEALVGTAATVSAGVFVGLGAVAFLFDWTRPSAVGTAVKRYVIAAGLLSAGGVVVVTGSRSDTTAGSLMTDVVGAAVTALFGTTDPAATAGPTMFLLCAGLLLVRRACRDVSPPLVFTDTTRAQIRNGAARLRRDSGYVSIVVFLVAAALLRGHLYGTLAATSASSPLVQSLVLLLGSPILRGIALLVVAAGLLALLGRWLVGLRRTDLVGGMTGAVFPVCGTLATVVVLAVGAPRVAPPTAQAGITQLATQTLPAPVPSSRVLLAGVGIVAAVAAAAVLVVLFFAGGILPDRDPGTASIGASLAALPVAAATADAPTVVVVALVVPAVVVLDAGRMGSSMAAAVGQRGSTRAELTHAIASLSVGAAVVGVGVLLRGVPASVTLPTDLYVIAIGTFVTAFVLLGRLLSV